MTKLQRYLKEYDESHMNKINILIHKFCVPLIIFSVLGIFKALPVPESWPLWLDLSYVLIFLSFIYYSLFKNIRVVLSILMLVVPMMILLEMLRPRFFLLSLGIFILAWIAQFIGHKIEGKKPSFLKDLQFLLIGPVWTMNKFMGQIGVDLKINSAKEI